MKSFQMPSLQTKLAVCVQMEPKISPVTTKIKNTDVLCVDLLCVEYMKIMYMKFLQ